MVWGAILSVGASLLGARSQRRAAQRAADAQIEAGQRATEQFQPWQEVGTQALSAQQRLLGLAGAGAQQQDITALEQSPMFQSLMRQSEDAMLQNAAATGGLRGGNIQAALAQFRPQMLQDQITDRFNMLGGLAGQGLVAAQGVAGGFTNVGQAQAGGVLARERANQAMIGALAQGAGSIFQQVSGGGGFSGWGR